jgi:hypothetical protein
LARWILPQSRLNHIAHDDFVDCFGLDARAANRFSNGLCAELRRGKGSQSALKFSNGGANSAKDYSLVHGCSPGHEKQLGCAA